MDEEERRNRNCVICQRGLYNARYQRHALTDELPRTRPELAAYIREHADVEVPFNNTQSVCHRCWQRAQLHQRDPAEEQAEEDQAAQVQVFEVPEYTRAPNTSNHCIFRDCPRATRLRIPNKIKVYLFCTYNLYVPDRSRVCREHMQSNMWDELPQSCNATHFFNPQQFTKICDMMKNAVIQGSRLDFNTAGSMCNNEMLFWTGRSHDQFGSILEMTPSLGERCRDPRTALGAYLIKLRTGDSNERIATLLNMSRRNLERLLNVARECLENEYVILHLGVDHIQTNEILNRNLTIPKGLFGNADNNAAIILCDGTYIYINKSSNFLFQRQSYSLHKYQNLLKPFLLVCSDGYIIDVKGPYAATKTDSDIMTEIMEDEENPLHILMEPNDALILDRGFRDAVPAIEACGYRAYMPPTKDRNETQLTTPQANISRSVTLCRWVIEVVNGRIKRDFRLLRHDYFNRALRHMFRDVKIAAALLNHFHQPITDSQYATEFLTIIRERFDAPNLLHPYVQDHRLNIRRADFTRLDATDVQGFPSMSEEQVILLSVGTYQLKLARSYAAEHLRNGLYSIEICSENVLNDLSQYGIDDDVWLLRGRIQSRHVRSRIYYCYVLIKHNWVVTNKICQCYCTCMSGRRTIGTYAHIISIIWYLGYARHHGFLHPAAFLDEIIVDHIME